MISWDKEEKWSNTTIIFASLVRFPCRSTVNLSNCNGARDSTYKDAHVRQKKVERAKRVQYIRQWTASANTL